MGRRRRQGIFRAADLANAETAKENGTGRYFFRRRAVFTGRRVGGSGAGGPSN